LTTPAIVIKTQFTKAHEKSFQGFVSYIDRKNTKANENNFENYQDYMSNDEKSTGLFTKDSDFLSNEEKLKVKDVFKKSQEHDGVMWQDVISFDNVWLKDIGVLKNTPDGQFIDEQKLKQATRNAVNQLWNHEGINDSIYWSAAIHYNTDNVHIHVASVQTRDFRERGMRKKTSLTKMKSAVTHTLTDRSKENAMLNDFIRKQVVKSKQENKTMTLQNRIFHPELVKQFKKIHSMLPQEDKRMWSYGMNGISNIRPEIDKLTDQYIQKHFPNEFKEFKAQLDKEVIAYKRIYGSNAQAEKYRETKMTDLYKRTGNTILKEIKDYDKQLKLNQFKNSRTPQQKNFLNNRAVRQMMYRVNREMRDDIQHIKNQREFERFEYEKERDRT
jgi:hypothetical protein